MKKSIIANACALIACAASIAYTEKATARTACACAALVSSAPLSAMVLDTIGQADNISTDADCEHAEKVLTSYAKELAEQGKSEREIRAALAELAAEY